MCYYVERFLHWRGAPSVGPPLYLLIFFAVLGIDFLLIVAMSHVFNVVLVSRVLSLLFLVEFFVGSCSPGKLGGGRRRRREGCLLQCLFAVGGLDGLCCFFCVWCFAVCVCLRFFCLVDIILFLVFIFLSVISVISFSFLPFLISRQRMAAGAHNAALSLLPAFLKHFLFSFICSVVLCWFRSEPSTLCGWLVRCARKEFDRVCED